MRLWATPTTLFSTNGAAEGISELNAFDNALLAAGIGNLNLVKLSSIVPAGVRLVPSRPAELGEGDIVPCVFSSRCSSAPGAAVAAAIGIGLQPHGGYGVMFEHKDVSMYKTAEALEAEVKSAVFDMVEAGFRQRGLPLDTILITAASHTVGRTGCALAAVLLWG